MRLRSHLLESGLEKMKKLIIKVGCMLHPEKLDQLRQDIEKQFYNGGAIALDSRFSCEVIEVEADTVEVVSGADTRKENMDS